MKTLALMSDLNFTINFDENLEKELSPSKARVVEAISYGMSNKVIAETFNISIKAVEGIFSELNKRFDTRDPNYNSRIRIIAALIANQKAEYQSDIEYPEVKMLNETLQQTLLLTASGLSTKAIASLCQVSTKTVEQRLSQLYDYFGVDTRRQDAENPRVMLLVNALLKGNLRQEHLAKLVRQTARERLDRIINSPEYFLEAMLKPNNYIG